MKITLWEENIETLEEQACYTLQNFVVHEYNCKYLGWRCKDQGPLVIMKR